jgi:hypothetical protein
MTPLARSKSRAKTALTQVGHVGVVLGQKYDEPRQPLRSKRAVPGPSVRVVNRPSRHVQHVGAIFTARGRHTMSIALPISRAVELPQFTYTDPEYVHTRRPSNEIPSFHPSGSERPFSSPQAARPSRPPQQYPSETALQHVPTSSTATRTVRRPKTSGPDKSRLLLLMEKDRTRALHYMDPGLHSSPSPQAVNSSPSPKAVNSKHTERNTPTRNLRLNTTLHVNDSVSSTAAQLTCQKWTRSLRSTAGVGSGFGSGLYTNAHTYSH